MTQSTRLRALRCLAFGVALLGPASATRHCASAEPSTARRTRTVQAIEAARPAVVNIEGTKAVSRQNNLRDTDPINGMGAGVIIDSSGYILTNQHVVEDVGRIDVTLYDGRRFAGQLVARDEATDLALIRIRPPQPLPEIQLGTSSDLMLGEPVIAIGNPFGYHHTVTEGIISALHRKIPVNGVREYPDLIQTDASINPGNSGGPLLNADGVMIGINAAVRIGAQGIGFAIPVDKAIEVAAEMVGSLRDRRNDVFTYRTERDGIREKIVVDRSSATALKRGDVIRSLAGRRVENRLHLELALLSAQNRGDVEVEVERDGTTLAVNLATGPSSGASHVRLTSTPAPARSAEAILGLRLQPMDPSDVQQIDDSYQGGMRVVAVTRGGLADRAQIRPGDILVGLLQWQTAQWDDVDWILESDEWRTAEERRFHIIRGNDVFWGTLDR
ncbi:MAG: serine protease [Pirellulaceae bacterium]|nr:MAG: serine protease [Pirellulaceae bacterium]